MKNRSLSLLACGCLILAAFLGGLYLGRSLGGTPVYAISTPSGTSSAQVNAGTHASVATTEATVATEATESISVTAPPTQSTTNTSGSININTADLETLQRLPKIGPKLAQAIIDHREKNGPFQSIGEITNVDGIGAGIFKLIKDYITIGG